MFQPVSRKFQDCFEQFQVYFMIVLKSFLGPLFSNTHRQYRSRWCCTIQYTQFTNFEVFRGHFIKVTGECQDCFKESFKGVSGKFWGCLNIILKVIPCCFKKAAWVFLIKCNIHHLFLFKDHSHGGLWQGAILKLGTFECFMGSSRNVTGNVKVLFVSGARVSMVVIAFSFNCSYPSRMGACSFYNRIIMK